MARPRLVSDEQILQTARALFLAHGPDLKVEAIAAELGVTTPVIFQRFGRKSDLIVACFMSNKAPASLVDIVPLTPDQRPLEDQLVEIGTRILLIHKVIGPSLSLAQKGGFSVDRFLEASGAPTADKIITALAAWIEAAALESRARCENYVAAASLFFGGLIFEHGFIRDPALDWEALDLEAARDVAKAITRQFLRGLSPTTSS